jgi:hypothetical protein
MLHKIEIIYNIFNMILSIWSENWGPVSVYKEIISAMISVHKYSI